MSTRKLIILLSSLGFVLILGLIVGACYVVPKYNVWSAGKRGEAELMRAEQNRRITVLEATALRDSAKMKAEAEVERAKGVAEANRIISDSLKGHDEYLRYLWIDKVAENHNREIVYVPTEANIPILEAGRLSQPPAPQATSEK